MLVSRIVAALSLLIAIVATAAAQPGSAVVTPSRIGGSCSTTNGMPVFSATQTLACSGWTDTGAATTYAGTAGTVIVSGANPTITTSAGLALDVRTVDGQPFWIGSNGARRWQVDANGHFVPNGNTFTLGNSTNGPASVFNAAFVFANIGTVMTTNGQMAYCSDCKVTTGTPGNPSTITNNTCTSAGNGALVVRLNGVNVCVQ